MRAAIYNPYLDSLGGGERYSISVAKVLSQKGFEVDIQWDDGRIIKKLEQRYGFNLENVNVVKDIYRGRGYDLIFWVSDGSVPLLLGKKNLLHFQIPFRNVRGKSLKNKIKFAKIAAVICNSRFTKKVVDREYGIESRVVYPAIDVENFKPGEKKNIILTVGRFSQLTQAKNQHILVDVFSNMQKKGLSGWKLVLAGGTEVGADNYLNRLREVSKGRSIEIVASPDFESLKRLYSKAEIYWSASGCGVDEDKNPEKVEHFGIAVVEAMSAGCVPLAYNAGGHKEIITNTKDGFLWDSKDQLANLTKKLIDKQTLLSQISSASINKSREFSFTNFSVNIGKYI
jgi:glycosyltransferase involved in cell wall biosynthesis